MLAAGRGSEPGDKRGNIGLHTSFDLPDMVVDHISQHLKIIHTGQIPDPLGHIAQQISICDGVGDFVIWNERMFLIDTCLDVVTNIRPAIAADGHHAAIGIGEGDLGLAALVKLLIQFLGFLRHAFHFIDFLL
jgi:hypothetical protein